MAKNTMSRVFLLILFVMLVLVFVFQFSASTASGATISGIVVDSAKNGIISLAGPVVSLLISIILLSVILYGGSLAYIGIIGMPISMVACVYSLLPFAPMEGNNVWKWNKLAWGIVFIPSLLLYLGLIILLIPT